MKITPTGNRVLVELSSIETTTGTGLIIPEQAREKPNTGRVVEVGPGQYRNGNLISIEAQGIKVGDEVLLASAYVGSDIGADNKILVDVAEIMAVV